MDSINIKTAKFQDSINPLPRYTSKNKRNLENIIQERVGYGFLILSFCILGACATLLVIRKRQENKEKRAGVMESRIRGRWTSPKRDKKAFPEVNIIRVKDQEIEKDQEKDTGKEKDKDEKQDSPKKLKITI